MAQIELGKFGKDFLEKYTQLGQRIQQSIAPLIEHQEELSEIINVSFPSKILSDQKLQDVISTLKKSPIFDIVKQTAITELIKSLEKSQKEIEPLLQVVSESLRNLPQKLRSDIMALSEEGWFYDLNMEFDESLHYDGDKLLLNDELEKYLIEFFQVNAKAIQLKVETKYPDRSHIISAAFDAYNRGDYYLAIPVIFAQVDGICHREISANLFLKGEWDDKISQYLDENSLGWLPYILVSLLTEPLPIKLSRKKRGNNFTGLNRHIVMHGESLDYGTQPNALKAISLLNYVYNVFDTNEKST